METYKCSKISYSYQGKIELGEALVVPNKKEHVSLSIVDQYIQKEMIHLQILKRFRKLFKQLNFYLEQDDDSGVAYQEILNEAAKFRSILRKKYHDYIKEEEEKTLLASLDLFERRARSKLLFLMQKQNIQNKMESRRER